MSSVIRVCRLITFLGGSSQICPEKGRDLGNQLPFSYHNCEADTTYHASSRVRRGVLRWQVTQRGRAPPKRRMENTLSGHGYRLTKKQNVTPVTIIQNKQAEMLKK